MPLDCSSIKWFSKNSMLQYSFTFIERNTWLKHIEFFINRSHDQFQPHFSIFTINIQDYKHILDGEISQLYIFLIYAGMHSTLPLFENYSFLIWIWCSADFNSFSYMKEIWEKNLFLSNRYLCPFF